MAKRKHGEGSVFQRKDGRWVAQIVLENGQKRPRYFKTEKAAQVALRKMPHEKEQGTLITGPQQTLKAYLEQWLEQEYKLSTIRTSTYNMYRIVINKHIVPVLGHIQLQRLMPQQVRAFYVIKLDEGLSSIRVKAFHAVLHRALENAVKWNLVAKNVCDLVTSPVPQRREMQTLTHEQVQCLLQAAHLEEDFKRLLESAGLPNIRFHDVRHSAATILLGMGVHPKIVQELLGHSTISMTMDIYSHVLPSM